MYYIRFGFLFITIISVFVFDDGARAKENKLESVLDTLDVALSRQPRVQARRHDAIDSIKRSMMDSPLDLRILAELGEAYHGLNNDSSIHYYQRAVEESRRSGETGYLREVLPSLAERYAKASRFLTAFNTLDSIDISGWNDSEKVRYYSSLSHVCLDAMRYSSIVGPGNTLSARAMESLDSLLNILGETRAGNLIRAQKYFLLDQPALALGELNDVFENQDPFSPEYAIMANMLASYYKDKQEHGEEYIYYLALSAISDARRANGEAVSLAHLGDELLERDDMERAFRYLTTAGKLIGDSNAKIYGSEIGPSLSRFATIWSSRETETRKMYNIAIIVLLMILSVAFAVIIYVSRKRKFENLQSAHLSDSLINRDLYINQLINLCGVYVEGLEEFNRLVARKLKVNQTQDLYKMIESGKIMQEQTEHFFEVFDDAITKIFPHFIAELNSLLLPDRQVAALPGNRLSPELHIIAFMRLGVTDSNRLSKFLGLSLNTIYTYRNRMKSRAKNRDTYEEDVLKLGKNI